MDQGRDVSRPAPTPQDGRGGQASEPVDGLLLSDSSVEILELAAASRGDTLLGTFEILVAAIALDSVGAWETVQLRATFVRADERERYHDHSALGARAWRDVPLTATAASALEFAAQISADFAFAEIPPGVLALGLIRDPQSGAARALLEEAEVDHAELAGLIQDEVLDVGLEGLAVSVDEIDRAVDAETVDASVEFEEAGPFPGAAASDVAPNDVTRRPDAERVAAPPPAAAELPSLTKELDERLSRGQQLRRRGSETEPWVVAVDDRVLKIYGLPLDDRERQRRLAEAEIGLALGEFDGVVATLAVHDCDGFLVIEMPRMGPSLAQHLDDTSSGAQQRLTPELYTDALVRVARTLHAMHEQGLVHRHVKPANLLTNPASHWLEVADFSITRGGTPTVAGSVARTSHRWGALTRTNEVLGTDRYIAPEVYDGEVGPSVDQYALAVTARDVLAGPDAPRLTTPVHEVLQRASAPRPQDRFASIGDFGAALERAVRAEAPRGLADRVAVLRPHRRAALAPALLAAVACTVLSSVEAREQLTDPALALLVSILGTPLLVYFTLGTVTLAGAVRKRLGWPNVEVVRSHRAPVVLSVLIGGLLMLTVDDYNWYAVIAMTLVGVYGLRALLASPRPDAGHGAVAVLRRWDRRRSKAPFVRHLISSSVVAALLVALAAPLFTVLAWPGEMPTEPVNRYAPLASVWNLRSALGRGDLTTACRELVELPASRTSAPCRDLARFAGAVQNADPVSRSPMMAGATGTFDTFRAQELPTPGVQRVWQLLTPAEDLAGSMYTEGTSGDRVIVMFDREVPSQSRTTFRSLWLYEVDQRPNGWAVTGFRACDLPSAGSGRSAARCLIKSNSPRAHVRAALAKLRGTRGGP